MPVSWRRPESIQRCLEDIKLLPSQTFLSSNEIKTVNHWVCSFQAARRYNISSWPSWPSWPLTLTMWVWPLRTSSQLQVLPVDVAGPVWSWGLPRLNGTCSPPSVLWLRPRASFQLERWGHGPEGGFHDNQDQMMKRFRRTRTTCGDGRLFLLVSEARDHRGRAGKLWLCWKNSRRRPLTAFSDWCLQMLEEAITLQVSSADKRRDKEPPGGLQTEIFWLFFSALTEWRIKKEPRWLNIAEKMSCCYFLNRHEISASIWWHLLWRTSLHIPAVLRLNGKMNQQWFLSDTWMWVRHERARLSL